MLFLILSILSSTLIGLIFTYFEKYKVDTFQAVVVNYFVCILTAWASTGSFPITSESLQADWLPFALFLSLFFISGFNIVGQTYQKFGITITTIATRMSMILTVIFAYFFYNETMTLFKILGILTAIAAIWLTTIPHGESTFIKKKLPTIFWLLPAFSFLIQAIVEIGLQYAEINLLQTSGDPTFVATLFGSAGMIGLVILIGGVLMGRIQLAFKNLLGGIILGIPNYFSIYFLLRAIGNGWEGTVVFPVNNVAVIGLSALLGYLLLKEKLSALNIVGVFLAMLAILLITWQSLFSS